jgi:hypothetical protein
MSKELVEAWLLIVMAASFAAMLAGYWLTHTEYWITRLDKTFRSGFIFMALGLAVQTYRSIYFIQFGHYPVDEYFPAWIVKDIGFCTLVYSACKAAVKCQTKEQTA